MLQKFNERNRDLIVNINGRLVHRDHAGISPFDSAVQGGDAVWEGLRVYNGRIFKLIEHLDRLRGSALALAFAEIPSHEWIIEQIRRTLDANQMRDGVHIRLTLTRGVKLTSGMDPRLNVFGPTLIVLAEHKPPVYDKAGITLVTASVRRFSADCLDPKIHHNNLLQSILAKIEANVAGADDALMLDTRGFVAETNATHVFLVDRGRVFTPRVVACPEGITRATVLELCRQHNIPCEERDLSLAECYRADEMFCTGTMGELAPVTQVDGRVIGRMNVPQESGPTSSSPVSSSPVSGNHASGNHTRHSPASSGVGGANATSGGAGPMTRRLSELFTQLTKTEGYPILVEPAATGSPGDPR